MIGKETMEGAAGRLRASLCQKRRLFRKGVAAMFTVRTSSPEETAALGERIGTICPRGAVFALAGDLGAGKTLFVQGLARGLGFSGEVTSPTFNLMNVYEGKMRLTHFDVYRLERVEELDAIGFYEYAEATEGIVLIEWAEKFPDAMPEDRLQVRIDALEGEGRQFTFAAEGEKSTKLLKELDDIVDREP